MRRLALFVALAPMAAWAVPSSHFTVAATWTAPKKRAVAGSVAVRFTPLDPSVRINEEPAPRLKLDPSQKVFVYKEPSGPVAPPNFDPEFAKYLDLSQPVTFPVFVAPGSPKGPQTLRGSVTYFYCSKKEGWCKKGTSDFEVVVDLN